jgi:membrane-associated protease RseP (regulator of RpoE activity)
MRFRGSYHDAPAVVGAAPPPERIRLNVVLFLLTCGSMLLSGSLFFFGSPAFDALRPTPWWWLAGTPFAGTLLAILVVHEFGHYVTARRHGASVSLPYFIPAPFLLGTLGALIRMRSNPRDRNALLDIAAAGPLAGLAVAVPAAVVGLSWSHLVAGDAAGLGGLGPSLLLHLLVTLRFGVLPEGVMVMTHPVADAAWAGFLVTAINLFPVGQLDGGRIAYALFGRHHRRIGQAAVAAAVAMGLAAMYVTGSVLGGMNWLVWAVLVRLLIGFGHQPPVDDITPLTPGRRIVGLACLGLLVLLVPPVVTF